MTVSDKLGDLGVDGRILECLLEKYSRIHLVQNTDQWGYTVNTVRNL